MSNRLKRKLNDLGVDTSSSKANESFCLIGTPLPPLEKSKDLGEFVPLWKQEVRDEKGRRRLHGAFTGGFSAGYFNTVGSAEGWTPSTFVSSRAGRAKLKASRPEDFMDEEDLQELRESRSLVDTTEEMDLTGGTAAELKRRQVGDDTEQDSIVHVLQSTLLPPPADSAGARILKKMGWRLGQGIGPRISLRQRKLQDLQASSPYGTRAAVGDVKVGEEDEEADKHTYARRDTPVLAVEKKDDVHGLAYRSGATLHESLGRASQGAVKGPTIAAGFGLGALNDADDDDVDVYDADLNTGRNRLAYDAEHKEDTITIGERMKASANAQTRSMELHSTTFRDGIRVLAGFLLSEKPLTEDRWFPLPDVPPNWQPNPRRVLEADKENIPQQDVPSEPLPYGKWKSSGMTASERGDALGETPLHTGPRSVFDYLSEKDRERLKNIASATASGVSAAAAAFSTPRTEPHIAEAALKGFQPFTSDPAKQLRYTAYLLSQATPNSTVAPLHPLPDQPLDKFQRELEDYAKAATIFKPVSGAMAGRFQSAAHIENAPTVHEGLHQPTEAELTELENKRKKEEEEKVSPQAHAAKLGMYGAMTREVKPWQPARLLCKRFGLKDPDPPPDMHESPAPGTGSTPASEVDASFQQTTNANFEAGSSAQISETSRNLANIGLGEDDTQGRDTLSYQRPTMDVFKAIFASDDESNDDEQDDDEPEAVKGEEPEAVNGATGPPAPLLDNQPVNLSTFKPTFIPRGGKSKESKEGRSKEKAKKERKKKERKGPLVSFDVEEDAEGLTLKSTKERPKKKRKKDKPKREGDEDDEMWVEKETPDIVKDMQIPVVEPAAPVAVPDSNDSNNGSNSMHKGRKRASDFL